MAALRKYEAVTGASEKEYTEVYEIEGASQEDAKYKAKIARIMGGVFWSEAKQRVLPGTFELQKIIPVEEFKLKLKNYVDCRNKS